jgi:hypothetical protein
MINELNLLDKFVPKSEFKSATWECFNVADGQVTATDFAITMSMYIPELAGFNFNVPAHKFTAAISVCKNPQLSQNDDVLTIRDGSFKIDIQLIMNAFGDIFMPEGEGLKFGPILPVLKVLQGFMGSPKRPNLQGIFFNDNFAYASDGSVAAKIPCMAEGISAVIPAKAISELLNNGNEPVKTVLNKNQVAFFYTDKDWLQANVLDTKFPDINKILNKVVFIDNKVDPALLIGINQILQFTEGEFTQITFDEKGIKGGSAEFYISSLYPSCWNGKTLRGVLELAETINFEAWPNPAGWRGANGLEGVLCGLIK